MLEEPRDLFHRCAYADYLEEFHGDSAELQFLRAQLNGKDGSDIMEYKLRPSWAGTVFAALLCEMVTVNSESYYKATYPCALAAGGFISSVKCSVLSWVAAGCNAVLEHPISEFIAIGPHSGPNAEELRLGLMGYGPRQIGAEPFSKLWKLTMEVGRTKDVAVAKRRMEHCMLNLARGIAGLKELSWTR